MKRWLVPVLIVAVIAAGVGGFFGGKATASKATTSQSGPPGNVPVPGNRGTGTFPGGRNANGGGFTRGSIVSKDDASMTVKLTDGSTKIVFYSASTAVSETKDISVSAVAVGTDITVVGKTNSDGSITATRIQLGSGLAGLGNGGPPAQTGASGDAAGNTATPGTPAGSSTATSR